MKKPILTILCLMVILAACAQPKVSPVAVMKPGRFQMEVYLPALENQRVAFCGNHTALMDNHKHLVDSLLALRVNVVKLFCPEHGFRGQAEAGATISSGKDAQTGLPVVSLYGKNKKPTAEQLKDVDVILFDLQDVGCRFYTYISTLHYVMEAAAENNVKVIVLDNPNPNGYYVDGPVLDPKFKSFVGMHPVPIVYGMTIGEYAQMINGEKWLANDVKCDLEVVKIWGYDRKSRYELGMPPSPNLQTKESIYLYPSLCLFEGTNISVGRGTKLPFEMYGAPLMQAGDYTFTPHTIPGVSENPPHKDKECRGFLLHDEAVKGLQEEGKINLEYLLKAYQSYADKDHFFINSNFFDKLAGTDQLRKQIMEEISEEDIRESWQPDLEHFREIRKTYLLYEE